MSSKRKENDPGNFVPGRDSDEDEKALGEAHVKPASTDRSVDAPAGSWVDVPKGMVAAPGTYVDAAGVLRDEKDNSCVMWHHVCVHHGRCARRGIQPHEIIYLKNKAGAEVPWCPDCVGKMKEDAKRKELEEMFGQAAIQATKKTQEN